MSIILDALKKAQDTKQKDQKENVPVSGEAFGSFKPQPLPKADGALSSTTRIIVLMIVAIVVLGFVLFYGYGKKLLSQKQITAIAPITVAQAKTATTQQVASSANSPSLPKSVNSTVSDEQKKAEKISQLKGDAILRFEKFEYEASASLYKELINLAPSDAEAYNNYGVVLKRLNKATEAAKAYSTALALNPNYVEALNNLAVVEISERQYNEAKRKLEIAIELNPDYIDPYLHLAICYEKLGDIATATKFYKSFLTKSEGKIDRRIRLQIEDRLSKLEEEKLAE